LLFLALGVAFGFAVYANAAVWDWWAGEAFGARRFLSCFTIFTVGLAVLMERFPKPLAAISGLLVLCNLLLFLQYQAFMHGLERVAPYPSGTGAFWLARFVVPWRLAWLWWQG
jgi:hypothetical protein